MKRFWKFCTGMTLMELIVVVAIIALIATVAYPNYIRIKQSTRRADAQSSIIALQAMVERYLAENNRSYLTNDDMELDLFENYASGGDALSNGGYYKMQIEPDAAGNGYIISAIAIANATGEACTEAVNAQALDQCSDSACWTLFIENGEKKSQDSEGSVADASTTTCW